MTALEAVTYRFSASTPVTLAALREADPIRQAQVRQVIEAYTSDRYVDFEASVRALRDKHQVGETFELELYEITPPGAEAPSHVMWVLFSDNGMIFPLGSPEATAVHCVQGHFWSVDDDDLAAVELAAALDELDAPF